MKKKDVKDNLLQFKMRDEKNAEEVVRAQQSGPLQQGGQGPLQQDGPVKQQIKIKASDLPDLKCSCGSVLWIECIRVKIISKVISNSGKDELQAIPAIVCKECAKDLNEMGEL